MLQFLNVIGKKGRNYVGCSKMCLNCLGVYIPKLFAPYFFIVNGGTT